LHAHRGIVAILDAISAHDHVAGAKHVDGVAVLSGAAGAGLDVLDAVVRDQRAVVADGGAQDLDAVVVGRGDGVARHDQAPGVERHHRGCGCSGDDVAADIAKNLFEPDRVAAAARDLAIDDADVATTEAMDQAAPGRQCNTAAVERDAVKTDAAGAFARQHRGTAVEDEFCRAAHADQLRAAFQAQHSGAIDAARQREGSLRARGFIDRTLQRACLVVGAAGSDAILRDVAAE
jgi:hypothetical protein